jgi:hypothetical protein
MIGAQIPFFQELRRRRLRVKALSINTAGDNGNFGSIPQESRSVVAFGFRRIRIIEALFHDPAGELRNGNHPVTKPKQEKSAGE